MNSDFSGFLEDFSTELKSLQSDHALCSKVSDFANLLINLSSQGSLIAICGNGGSMADAMHFSAELTVRYKQNRKAINSIALSADPVFSSACSNDFGFEQLFSRNIEAICSEDDIVICITTSGRSKNIISALATAKAIKCHTVVLCGSTTEHIEALSDFIISVPGKSTATIQSMHKLIYHWICDVVESSLKNA